MPPPPQTHTLFLSILIFNVSVLLFVSFVNQSYCVLYITVRPSVCLIVVHLSDHPSVRLSVCLSVCLYLSLTFFQSSIQYDQSERLIETLLSESAYLGCCSLQCARIISWYRFHKATLHLKVLLIFCLQNKISYWSPFLIDSSTLKTIEIN